MAPIRPNCSIKDFFRPSPPSQATLLKLQEQQEFDEDCIVLGDTEGWYRLATIEIRIDLS
jgi:hypothetical protein